MQKIDGSRLTVIVPAFNEEEGIVPTLRKLKDNFPDVLILVINDGSEDKTHERAKSVPGVTVLTHEVNRGYGASLKTGMKVAKTEFVAWYDADGQHQPEDLAGVVLEVQSGEYDACFGTRGKGSSQVARRAPGKWILRTISQIVARRKIPDLNCGLRCFRSSVIKRYLHLLPDGFSASTTSTLLMMKRGYRVKFRPIKTEPRVGKSSVRMFRDGFFTLKLILRIFILFDAFLFFTSLALVQVVAALMYSAWVMSRQHLGFPQLGALVVMSGFLTFAIGIISAQINEMRQEQFEFRAMED